VILGSAKIVPPYVFPPFLMRPPCPSSTSRKLRNPPPPFFSANFPNNELESRLFAKGIFCTKVTGIHPLFHDLRVSGPAGSPCLGIGAPKKTRDGSDAENSPLCVVFPRLFNLFHLSYGRSFPLRPSHGSGNSISSLKNLILFWKK